MAVLHQLQEQRMESHLQMSILSSKQQVVLTVIVISNFQCYYSHFIEGEEAGTIKDCFLANQEDSRFATTQVVAAATPIFKANCQSHPHTSIQVTQLLVSLLLFFLPSPESIALTPLLVFLSSLSGQLKPNSFRPTSRTYRKRTPSLAALEKFNSSSEGYICHLLFKGQARTTEVGQQVES